MSVAVERNHSRNLLRSRPEYNSQTTSIDFISKLKYDSEASRSIRRSQLFKVPEKPVKFDIWKLPPPDFNPQAFESTPRTAVEAVRKIKLENAAEIKSKSAPNAHERRRSDRREKELFKELEQMAIDKQRAQTCNDFRPYKEKPRLQLRFRRIDPLQAKVDFAKYGKHPDGEYEMPQLHDFRQYLPLKLLGLPEFVTSHEKDCFGLKCKNEGIGIVQGRPGNFLREVPVRTKAEYAMPRHPKWNEKLMLPKLPFPNKVASYSRHRRSDRSARSAFLERAEEMMEKRAREVEEFKKTYLNKY